MAKTSMKIKQQRAPKFSTRAYTRCRICGRPHSVLRKYGVCRICFRELNRYTYRQGQLVTEARRFSNACKRSHRGYAHQDPQRPYRQA